MTEQFTLFKNEVMDLETANDDFNHLSDTRDNQLMDDGSTTLSQFEQRNRSLDGVSYPSSGISSSTHIADQDSAYISRKLKESILGFEGPLKKLLAYTAIFFMMKLSRVILVLGLLLKLFFEMSCDKSSIQSLLLAAFLRDVFSSVLDMQLMFQVYELRYKIRM